MIPGKPFNPATGTSRRPTPEKFAHLRNWVEEIKRSIEITNITELTNINQQLEQNAKLFISNIISRTISQIIGKYGNGFVTIEGTSDGRLLVEATMAAAAEIVLAAGSNLIGMVQNAGTAKTPLQAAIDFSTAITSPIVAAVAAKKIKVINIMLTVGGETNLTFKSATDSISGPLDFGGTNEPRGMVQALGDFPLVTAQNEAFGIASSLAVQVSGYITYYTE